MKLSLVFIMFLTQGVSAFNETLHYFSDHYNLSTTVSLSPHQERNLQRRKSSTVSFYAMGDAPYNVHEMALFPKQIAKLDPDKADFAIHLGDMQDRTKHCEQRNYRDMKRLLERSMLPMFIIPGDNDHYDCQNKNRAFHYWEKHLGGMHKNWETPFKVREQDARRENFAFVYKRVLFLSVHTNQRKYIKNKTEWKQIERQNLRWAQNQINEHKRNVKVVVVFGHAYPNNKNYPVFWNGLSNIAKRVDMPFLFLQGDAHKWLESYPFKAKNILRVVVDRGGKADPVLVTVDADRKKPFRFQRRQLSKL